MLVGGDGFLFGRRGQFAMLAVRDRLPVISAGREFAQAGWLMAYGASVPDMFRQVGIYAGSIVKGAKPADLPVLQSTKFEFVINLQTARALGLDVPPIAARPRRRGNRMIRAREVITLLGGAAAWPLTSHAQQPSMPVIGFLHSSSPAPAGRSTAIFLSALSEVGFVVGSNVAIEYRWAENQYDRLPALAAELVRRRVSVLVAQGGSTSALAAKAATSTIPIVFSGGGDPVAQGLVASINRPGGNATGVRILDAATEGKRLGLLREMVPTAGLIGVLINPNNANFRLELDDVEQAARVVGQRIHVLRASTEREINVAFATLVQLGAGGLTVAADPFLQNSRKQIVALAARHSIPTIDSRRDLSRPAA